MTAGGTRVITLELQVGETASTCRFLLDTVSKHSIIRADKAADLSAIDLGVPSWASSADGVRQLSLGDALLGTLDCGELKIASIEGDLPVPSGACGILGLDFLQLFDWDLDVENEVAVAVTAPEDGLGPVPFNLDGMRIVPLMLCSLLGGVKLLSCSTEFRLRESDQQNMYVDCMTIADLGATCTICNSIVLTKLGIGSVGSNKVSNRKGFATAKIQQANMQLAIGTGPDGPVTLEAMVSVGDVEIFETLGLPFGVPAAILGPDVLCRSRLILSPRLRSIWLPS